MDFNCLVIVIYVIVFVQTCSSTEIKSKFISLYSKHTGLSPLRCAVQCVSDPGCQSFVMDQTGGCSHFTASSSCADRPAVKGRYCFFLIQEAHPSADVLELHHGGSGHLQNEDRNFSSTTRHSTEKHRNRCPVERKFTLYKEGGLCVRVVTRLKSWSKAEHLCSSYSPGSRLVTVDSRRRIDLVLRALRDTHKRIEFRVWIAEVKRDNSLMRGRNYPEGKKTLCWVLDLNHKSVQFSRTCSVQLKFVCELPLVG